MIVSKQVVHEKYEFDYEISKREIVVIDQLEISYTIEKQEKKNVYQVFEFTGEVKWFVLIVQNGSIHIMKAACIADIDLTRRKEHII